MCQVSSLLKSCCHCCNLSNRKTDIIVPISQSVLFHYATASGYNLRLLFLLINLKNGAVSL